MPDADDPARARKGDPLTGREQEVLALLATGSSLPEISARLGLALDTVRTHAASIYTKIGARPNSNALTRREAEILMLLAAGNSTPDIANELGITAGTVKTHLSRIYKKIGAKNRVQAARYYLDHLAPASET